jgi:hypothetical protein
MYYCTMQIILGYGCLKVRAHFTLCNDNQNQSLTIKNNLWNLCRVYTKGRACSDQNLF